MLKLFLLLLLKLMALNVLEAYALYLHVFARKVLKQLLASFPGRGDSNLLGEWNRFEQSGSSIKIMIEISNFRNLGHLEAICIRSVMVKWKLQHSPLPPGQLAIR